MFHYTVYTVYFCIIIGPLDHFIIVECIVFFEKSLRTIFMQNSSRLQALPYPKSKKIGRQRQPYFGVNLINIGQMSLQTDSAIHGQTIHPREKFISLNLFKIL